MASMFAESSSNPLYQSTKINPFRKSTYAKNLSINSGTDSPASLGTKKLRVRQDSKAQPQLPEQTFQEDFPSPLVTGEEERIEEPYFPEKQEEQEPTQPLLILPSVFDKYALTTDIPFIGIRTTKAKIEPIKVPEKVFQVIYNAKNTADSAPNSMSARKFQPNPSKGKLTHSPSKVYYPHESKPSLGKDPRKNREKESHSNIEKESLKYEFPTKNSLDVETELKEKQAFITEAQRSHNDLENPPDLEDYEDNEDNLSQKSDDKNKGRSPQQEKEIKSPIKERPKYDPMAVLNKIRSKDLTERGAMGRSLPATNRSPDSPKTRSQPRDFTVLRSKKINLFEGIPYVPYDVFLRQDTNMQNVMVKDLLKILLDKAKSLKNLFHDSYRMDRLMKNIEEPEQNALNLHTEETVGLINAVASLVMQEFRDSIDKIGIKPSPIYDNPDLKLSGFENEVERFYDNCNIFLETIDHLRDCIDCYYVMSRQKDRKPMNDSDCSDLLQFIARGRYNLGQLYEAFRVLEKHVDSKLLWEIQNDPIKNKEKMKKLEAISTPKNNNKLKADTYKLLNELLHHKFNINKNKSAATRESKVILNQEAEDEKFLTILQNQKQLKKKNGKSLGDNRKLIILNRLLNPIEDPQIQAAIKVAQEKTQVQLSRDLVEYMATKAKGVDIKTKVEKDIPLKNNLQKILSNKKLTHMNFDFSDNKEHQDILDKLSKGSGNQEVINSALSHTKTKRHLGCLFDKESLVPETTQLFEMKNIKLPKLHKASHAVSTPH